MRAGTGHRRTEGFFDAQVAASPVPRVRVEPDMASVGRKGNRLAARGGAQLGVSRWRANQGTTTSESAARLLNPAVSLLPRFHGRFCSSHGASLRRGSARILKCGAALVSRPHSEKPSITAHTAKRQEDSKQQPIPSAAELRDSHTLNVQLLGSIPHNSPSRTVAKIGKARAVRAIA